MSLNHFFIEINRIDVDSFLCEKNYFDKEVDGFGGINYLNMNNNYLFDDLDLTFVVRQHYGDHAKGATMGTGPSNWTKFAERKAHPCYRTKFAERNASL